MLTRGLSYPWALGTNSFRARHDPYTIQQGMGSQVMPWLIRPSIPAAMVTTRTHCLLTSRRVCEDRCLSVANLRTPRCLAAQLPYLCHGTVSFNGLVVQLPQYRIFQRARGTTTTVPYLSTGSWYNDHSTVSFNGLVVQLPQCRIFQRTSIPYFSTGSSYLSTTCRIFQRLNICSIATRG